MFSKQNNYGLDFIMAKFFCYCIAVEIEFPGCGKLKLVKHKHFGTSAVGFVVFAQVLTRGAIMKRDSALQTSDGLKAAHDPEREEKWERRRIRKEKLLSPLLLQTH